MISTTLVVSKLRPLKSALGEKLGRCISCMRLSVSLALGFWLVLALVMTAGADSALVLAAALPAAALTMWSIAHAVAYVARGPERAKGCRSCAEKAKARQRAARRQRRLSWLRPRGASAPPPQAGCRNCDGTKALKSEEAAAALPPADEGLRHVAEDSPEFASLRARLASPEPEDTWKVNMQSFFLYRLVPDEDELTPHALFITRWEDDVPVSAVVVTPSPDGGEPRTVNLQASAPSSLPSAVTGEHRH
ncbi:MAG: DUF3624 family protein [Burkholderiales bacterium]|jgi:hypothetical protein|nr:DUF3624 family protein [Burkholderiales bacterium]